MKDIRQDYFSHMNFKILISIIVIGILIISCTPSLYIPNNVDSEYSGLSLDSLKLGRNLYIANCGSCHNLHITQQFTKLEWDTILPKMKIKAKINERTSNLILKYLITRSKQITK